MTSEYGVQKFHSDDVHYPDLGSASDWLCCEGISFNQSEALPRSGLCMSSVWNFCARYSESFCKGSSGVLVKRRLFSQAINVPNLCSYTDTRL